MTDSKDHGRDFESYYHRSEEELRLIPLEELRNLQRSTGRSFLMEAIHRDEADIFAKFLQLGLGSFNTTKNGYCEKVSEYMTTAMRVGGIDCLKVLLQHNAYYANCKLTSRKVRPVSPLDYVISQKLAKESEIVTLLLQHGADPQLLSSLSIKKLAMKPRLLKQLLLEGQECSTFAQKFLCAILPNSDQTSCRKRMESIRILFDHGKVDVTDPYYLAWSCARNHEAVARLVLEYTPKSVLLTHDSYLRSGPALQKCSNPLCSVMWSIFEFEDDVLDCLKLLLSVNVPLTWDWKDDEKSRSSENNTLVPPSFKHKTLFDQWTFYDKESSFKSIDALRLLLLHGMKLKDVTEGEEKEILRQEGFGGVPTLQMCARHVTMSCIAPGLDVKDKVLSMKIPTTVHSFLLQPKLH